MTCTTHSCGTTRLKFHYRQRDEFIQQICRYQLTRNFRSTGRGVYSEQKFILLCAYLINIWQLTFAATLYKNVLIIILEIFVEFNCIILGEKEFYFSMSGFISINSEINEINLRHYYCIALKYKIMSPLFVYKLSSTCRHNFKASNKLIQASHLSVKDNRFLFPLSREL